MMRNEWADIDLLLDPYFLHLPALQDRVRRYPGSIVRAANLTQPTANLPEQTDLITALPIPGGTTSVINPPDGCKRPALKLERCRAAGLREAGRDQAGLDDACRRVLVPAGSRPQTRTSAGDIKERSSMPGPGRNASESGIHSEKRWRKHTTLRKSRSGTETLHGVSAGQTQVPTVAVETLNVLTQTCTGYPYRKMELKNSPT
ncbi:reverse transcriptase [Phytophthora megakarya]|uniref:Reverse transcriptase n=1 Tax=Phytophthora megakarya TaxID=4795 RepID=A0A225W1F6_9STRA|nr:reverse transcriptase [Phytophthora megakarya]